MKKILVIALAVLMLVGAVSVLAACNSGTTYTGYCYYPSPYGAGGYGCVVDVTVKGDTIVAIKLYTDEEAAAWAKGKKLIAEIKQPVADSDPVKYETVEKEVEWAEGTHRTTDTWMSEAEFAIYVQAYPQMEEALKYQVPHSGDLGYRAAEAAYEAWFEEVFIGKTVAEVNNYAAWATQAAQGVPNADLKIAGATQSSARIIVAVQNALAQINAK